MFALVTTYGRLALFHSNLYVYQLIVVTTYEYNNFYFMSTYVYECIINFSFCNLLYLKFAATHV